MPSFDVASIINQVAAQERAISGIKNSYNFAANPDSLLTASLPAVIHYSPGFELESAGHYNLWKTSIVVRSILFVLPRELHGGKLKFVENAAIPFGQSWIDKFTNSTIISTLLTNTGAQKAFLTSGTYGVGGEELTFGATEFVGWVFQFDFLRTLAV